MTHEISITQTDFGQYPLPGVNNDTQGFRDRFSLIQDKFDLLDEAVNTLELVSVKVNQNNDFGGNSITDAILRGSGDATKSKTSLSNTAESAEEIQWIQYNYFPYIVNSDSYLRFTEWPITNGILAKVTIELSAEDTDKDVVFMYGTSELKTETAFDGVSGVYGGFVGTRVTVPADTTKIYEFWTADRGVTLFARLVGTFS
jgi:hypothetical protein